MSAKAARDDLHKIAKQLHDLRFRVVDMANAKDDAVDRWLASVASEIEDIEFAVVVLSEEKP